MRAPRLIVTAATLALAIAGTLAFRPARIHKQVANESSQTLDIPGQPPETVLYRFLFDEARRTAQRAEEIAAANRDASSLRNFYESHAHLSRGENDSVFQVASDYANEVKANDSEARQIIQTWRTSPKVTQPNGAPPPPPPIAELVQLRAQRDSLVLQERDQLHLLLGDSGFDNLEVYVHGRFGSARRATPASSTGGVQ